MKSMKLVSLSGVAAACLLALVNPAAAADDVDITLKDGGFKVKSGGNEFKIGGKLQLDYVNFGDDTLENGGLLDDGANNRRAHLEFAAKLGEEWEMKYERDFVANVTKDAFLKYNGFGPGSLTVGQTKSPIGLEELTSDSWVSYMERSQPTNAFIDANAYKLGLVYGGTGDMFGAWGAVQFDAIDDKKAGGDDPTVYTGRVIFSPVHTSDTAFHVGLGYQYSDLKDSDTLKTAGDAKSGTVASFSGRTDLRNDSTATLFTSGTLSAESVATSNFEIAGVMGPFSASAEYFKAKTSGVDANPDYDLDGWYVEGSYFISGGNRNYKFKDGKFDRPNVTKGAWEIAARYSNIDLTDALNSTNKRAGDVDTVTVALNYYANRAIKIGFDYTQSDADFDNLSADEDVSAFGVRAQFAF